MYDWAGIAGRPAQSGMDHGFGPEAVVAPLSGYQGGERSLISGVAEELTHMASGSMPSRSLGKDRFRLSRGDMQGHHMV